MHVAAISGKLRSTIMILRDPVHGLVSFESDDATIVPQLIDTDEVQRLRHIRQLGLASLVYPGADHTRFAHALGAAHVMTRFIDRLRELESELPPSQRISTETARDAIAAALLHDLGHGPFSHLFEEALPEGPAHEDWTSRILLDPGTEVHRALAAEDPERPQRVADLVHGRHPLTFLARTVSGTFDVDRCDYLLRDAWATGVNYGLYDLDWLLRSLRFRVSSSENEVPGLAIDGARGLPAIESFILARLFMFQQVYFHKASRVSEWLLAQILQRARELLLDGSPLRAPAAVRSIALSGDASTNDYVALDEPALWGALSDWENAGDPVLADLTTRLGKRRLFKTYELHGDQALDQPAQEALSRAREVAERAGLDPNRYVGLDIATDVPFDDSDGSLTVVYPGGREKRPGDVSFVLGRLRGEPLRRVRLIFAPELRDGIVRAVESLG